MCRSVDGYDVVTLERVDLRAPERPIHEDAVQQDEGRPAARPALDGELTEPRGYPKSLRQKRNRTPKLGRKGKPSEGSSTTLGTSEVGS